MVLSSTLSTLNTMKATCNMTNTTLNYLTPFQVVSYVEGMENRLLDGQRLSVVRWKTPSHELGNPAYKKQSAVCASVPAISLSLHSPECLREAMQDALVEIQDKAIRAHVEQELKATPGISLSSIVLPSSVGTPEGLAAFCSAVAISSRLSKDSLEKWFDSFLSGPLVDLVVSKLPPETENSAEVAVAQVMKAKAAILTLASPRTAMPRQVAVQLQKAIALAPQGDRTKEQLGKKLELFINPPGMAELELAI